MMNTNRHMDCAALDQLMIDALFGDIEAEQKEKLSAHLAGCRSCMQAFTEMKSTLDITKQATVTMPPESYWPEFRSRLDERIAQRRGSVTRSSGPIDLVDRIRKAFWPQPAWALQLGLAVVLVAAGIFIGRYGFPDRDLPSSTVVEDAEEGTPAVVAAQTQRYLDRSSVLLLGLVNFDTDSGDPAVLNLEHKQKIAGNLVQEAALIKSALDDASQSPLRMLVEDLEKILLQIANLEAEENLPGIEMIQHGVEQRALLLKINLETMKRMDTLQPEENDSEISS